MRLHALSSAAVEGVVRKVCQLDVRALKPGNVSIYAPGHRMTAADFLRSAELIAPAISQEGLNVGGRIRCSVEATVGAVGSNTNLGIVLLLAPLVQSAMTASESTDLRCRTREVLARLTVADAEAAYEAIRLANPGGLGRSESQDVSAPPSVTLLKAMQLAADRDRVAHQYASGYEDIFAVGLSRLRDALARGWNEEWGAVACYLRFLATIADSHVVRKFGKATAAALQQRALRVETRFKACDNPESAVPMLLNVDEELKREGINPGTSADLTVATLAASRLETLLTSG